MSVILTSHIAQLLYRDAPQLNFAQLVGDIRNAFTPANGPAAVLTWDCDDIALLDFGTARVVIGFSENLPGAHAACLTVATDQKLMCRAVTKRLNRRFPGGANHSQTLDQPLTPDLIDRVVDALFELEDVAPQTMATTAITDVFPEVAAFPEQADANDTDHLLHRLSSELTTRPANMISRAIASATSKTPDVTIAAMDAAPLPAKAAKMSAGLFWRKTPNGPASGQHQASATELKAVRDALCARDTGHGGSRIAAQTKQALLGFVSSVADRRRGDSSASDARIKH